jgi:3-dehydroquinate synthase
MPARTPPVNKSGNNNDPSRRVVRVELGAGAAIKKDANDRSYDVRIGRGILTQVGPLTRSTLPTATRAMVVIDSGVPQSLQGALVGALAAVGIAVKTVSLTPSEQDKSLRTLECLLIAATEHKIERREPFISLGGGIIGDITGFAAATYRRGVPFVQCPTTLLAMVDAAVGGKTGANLALGAGGGNGGMRKNMVGAFWQPRLVLCDTAALDSLSTEEFSSGLGECVKHALIGVDWGDGALWDWMHQHADKISRRDHHVLAEMVARNVAIKARVVSLDEREESAAAGGGRMALNAGHTVGHALEAWAADSGVPLKHGYAVGLGLLAEMACGEAAGITTKGATDLTRQLLAQLGLPTRLPPSPTQPRADALLRLMGDDKKVLAGRLRLAVPTGDGRCRMLEAPGEREFTAGLRAIGAC